MLWGRVAVDTCEKGFVMMHSEALFMGGTRDPALRSGAWRLFDTCVTRDYIAFDAFGEFI